MGSYLGRFSIPETSAQRGSVSLVVIAAFRFSNGRLPPLLEFFKLGLCLFRMWDFKLVQNLWHFMYFVTRAAKVQNPR